MLNIPAISIRQPWAWFIVNGWKDIENRTWPLPQKYIGQRVYIHAGKHFDPEEIVEIFEDVKAEGLKKEGAPHVSLNSLKAQCGGIVGTAIFSGCVQDSQSPWASPEPGTFHWQIAEASPVDFIPCLGKLSFFTPVMHEAISSAPKRTGQATLF
jgi:hypothetical protein